MSGTVVVISAPSMMDRVICCYFQLLASLRSAEFVAFPTNNYLITINKQLNTLLDPILSFFLDIKQTALEGNPAWSAQVKYFLKL